MAAVAAGEGEGWLGAVVFVGDEFVVNFQNPPAFVEGAVCWVLGNMEGRCLGVDGFGQGEMAHLMESCVRDRGYVGIGFVGFAVVDVEADFEAGVADGVGNAFEVGDAIGVGVFPEEVSGTFGKGFVGEEDHGEAGALGDVDVFVDVFGRGAACPEVGVADAGVASVVGSGWELEVAFDDCHGVEEGGLWFLAAEEDGGGLQESGVAFGDGSHGDAVGVLIHLGVGADVAGTKAYAEVVVGGEVDPSSALGQIDEFQ